MGGGVNISKREEPRANFNAYLDSCHKETIKKEMRHHVIHEEYVPPQFMKKNWILADKPNNIDILHIVKDDPAVRAELPARQKFQAGPIYRDPFDPRFSRENGGQVLESQELGKETDFFLVIILQHRKRLVLPTIDEGHLPLVQKCSARYRDYTTLCSNSQYGWEVET
ncbi:hypothetical protein BCR33DRAFT_721391 [Rhizoclosmatium globosum]|uniref:Uncharacterized protein n=1 Tax=Rhizoclosmatium globosum TaxID=329046 RepID=A0A1Y2BSE2_9FUNG|nr:hypothetical protein BCR33DRAFT_721391 [Rhizoclosmatium globosum]|eukprot:ORY37668.1 hypothetical protein BCR33DRAFT_721391 [Rhizoclosmatium globosum]